MSFRVIIPARLQSTRLPRKVLLDIGGKTMLERVYEQALSSGAMSVAIATDSKEVYQVAEQFGATVCMTSPDHPTGTDRIDEAIKLLDYDANDIIVGVQGDEPFIAPQNIRQVAELLQQYPHAAMATLCEEITSIDDVLNPNVVKVVMNEVHEALYFSRAPIPWWRDVFGHGERDRIMALSPTHIAGMYCRHVGIYAYHAHFVQKYVSWPVAALEQVEKLEQLRVLAQGHQIVIAKATAPSPIGVDTEADLVVARGLV